MVVKDTMEVKEGGKKIKSCPNPGGERISCRGFYRPSVQHLSQFQGTLCHLASTHFLPFLIPPPVPLWGSQDVHKQSPKQIINLFASVLSHLVKMGLSKFIQVEYNLIFYNKHTLGITINI